MNQKWIKGKSENVKRIQVFVNDMDKFEGLNFWGKLAAQSYSIKACEL